MISWVIQALGQNPMCINSTTWRMMTRSPNATHKTRTVESLMIAKDAASALKSLDQKRSQAPCTMVISQNVSEH
jgi:hypothetical protein